MNRLEHLTDLGVAACQPVAVLDDQGAGAMLRTEPVARGECIQSGYAYLLNQPSGCHSGWSQTAYDGGRIGTWVVLIVGGLLVRDGPDPLRTPGGRAMIPAVIYAAKSTEDVYGSIPDQIADGRTLAAQRGLEIVAEFQDEAASAYHGDPGPGLAWDDSPGLCSGTMTNPTTAAISRTGPTATAPIPARLTTPPPRAQVGVDTSPDGHRADGSTADQPEACALEPVRYLCVSRLRKNVERTEAIPVQNQ